MSKIFAIGDIHGCHRQLVALLARLPLDRSEDTLVFLGDYINRGPDSRRVLDTLIGLQRSCRRAIFLKGNHEQALLDYDPDSGPSGLSLLRAMGIEATAESYGVPLGRLADLSCMPPEHQQFLFDLRLNFTCNGFFFTHADFDPAPPATATTVDETPRQRMRRHQAETRLLASRRLGREEALQPPPPWTVVFGHLPHATPLVRPDRIGIDTGAVYGNLLTAVQLPQRIFYHA
ncbi:MAG: serine/threonine protein phosphatase [Desulfobulbus sp.]|jgi:serine/threonine protein phosphatase 1|uniref:metallophosphoesterase family protein n=1 Tax=Desulfobulbus sp. TaxID=895 RepID=UPI002850EC63|nr:metallophosphoesterase family protein [Desulfobulbus sp.]MDR2550164.1 serine/threonine protein phosphatase [Desulfobulbus sp.]